MGVIIDEALSPHAKLQNVLYLIKRYSPAPFAFWRTKERKAYQATMEKAGLHCLLEGFTQGDMDEAQFLNKLAELHEHLDAPSTELNDFSIHFRTIYKDKITDQLNRTWIERNEDVKNPTLNLANEKQEEWKKLQGNTQIQRYCPNYHKTLTKALEAYERESKKKPVDVDNLMKFERKLTR